MIEELKQLGLEYYESRAVATLIKDKISVKNLSRIANIPFGKVYSVVKSLKERGIISETNTRPKLIFIENASEAIAALLKEKDKREALLKEHLKSFVSEIDRTKNKRTIFFQIGTTIEDNKEIQLRTFSESEKEVLQILNIYHKPECGRENKTIWEKEIEKAVKRGVIFKAIYPKNIQIPKILQRLNKIRPKNFQIKRYDTDFPRCDIIDRKKVLIKLVSNDPLQFGGIIFIDDEKLANSLLKIFMGIWKE